MSRTVVRFTVDHMPRVTEEHRASRREQILAAGWRCVARQGFHKTSMADIIRESGLSAGAVYLYFPSKDEIIVAIAEQVVAGADRIFDDVLASDPLPPLHEIVRLIVTRIERIATAGEGELIKVALPTWAEAVRNDSIRVVVGTGLPASAAPDAGPGGAPAGRGDVRCRRGSRAGRPGTVRADARIRAPAGDSRRHHRGELRRRSDRSDPRRIPRQPAYVLLAVSGLSAEPRDQGGEPLVEADRGRHCSRSRVRRWSNQCAVDSCSARNRVIGGLRSPRPERGRHIPSATSPAAYAGRRDPAARAGHPGGRADAGQQLGHRARLAVGDHQGLPGRLRARSRAATRASTALSR